MYANIFGMQGKCLFKDISRPEQFLAILPQHCSNIGFPIQISIAGILTILQEF